MKGIFMKVQYSILSALVIVSHILSAQTAWSSSNGTITFSKAGSVDWTLAANQDRISDSVWITRASSQRIFNIRKENVSSTNSPYGTLWAFGTTDSFATLTYKTFTSLSVNDPQSLIGKNLVLQLVAEKIYIDVKFLTYGSSSSGGTFSYVRAVSSGVTSVKDIAPLSFGLEQNYPNPFNPATTIGFTLQESGKTTLKIYDAIGREVVTLVEEVLEAGVYHQQIFDASRFASGVYFARLVSGSKVQVKKLMLMK